MPKTPRLSRAFVARAGAVVAVLALSFPLTACQGDTHPGTAAIVGGQAITEADVTQAVDELQPLMGQQVSRAAMVNGLVASRMYLDAASELGIELTDEEFEQQMGDQVEALGGDITALGASSRLILEPGLVMEIATSIGAGDSLGELAVQVPFEINPRYGSGNPLAEGMSLAEPLADSFR